jgi:hypothetical protein
MRGWLPDDLLLKRWNTKTPTGGHLSVAWKRPTEDVCPVDKWLNVQPWRNIEDRCLNLPDTIYTASTWIVPILIAITFHEAAHAVAAWRLGDDMAHRLGRVTFNPLKHVDPFGTILLPALLFLTKAPFLFG